MPAVRTPDSARLAVLWSWLAARVVVVGALGVAAFVASEARTASAPGGTGSGSTEPFDRQGLLGWDAAFYRDLAVAGYDPLPEAALRFFPGLALLVRVLAWPFGGGRAAAGVVLLLLVSAAALAYGLALVRLVRAEGWGDGVAARAVWLLALAPPAFVLVMGYAEAVAGLLAVVVFLGLRTGRFGLAAAAGLAAGLVRPSGVLLAAPALVEALRAGRGDGSPGLPVRVAAVLAPLAGAATYLGWVGLTRDDPLLPFSVQQDPGLHGPARNPVALVGDALAGLADGRVGTGLHVPWLALLLVLLVVMARRLPASYTVWSAASVAPVLVGSNLDSLERYGWAAFPFVVVGAMLLRTRAAWTAAVAVSAALLMAYATLAFLGLYVP